MQPVAVAIVIKIDGWMDFVHVVVVGIVGAVQLVALVRQSGSDEASIAHCSFTLSKTVQISQ